jgi:hypothetical protein
VLGVLFMPHYYSWIMLLVLLTPFLMKTQERQMILHIFLHPRPEEKPEGAEEFWPLWYVAAAFIHTRVYGSVFILAMILQTLLWRVIH